MGKNSNALKHRDTHAVDLQREREEDAKREARRARKAAKLAEQQGEMAVDVAGASGASTAATAGESGATEVRKKKFGKVRLGKAKKLLKVKGPSAAPIRASLELRKRSGIRKPSAVMRKTFKKLAKKKEMELG